MGQIFTILELFKLECKGKLSVNENCQLSNNKNVYIIDGSVFNFKRNKYPLDLYWQTQRDC